MKPCPRYLSAFQAQWAVNPRQANLAWFEQAAYGLFLHYGLYSQLARHEWVMLKEAIPIAEYEKLAESFNPSQFDADFIKRDLVRELAEQCDRKGLGFFAYYTHVLNWRHPYAITRDVLAFGRPNYPNGDPRYVLTKPEEWRVYWDYAQACIEELCRLDAPLAGPWLDIIRAYYQQPDLIPIEETYAKIRAARPEALISFKQGATGTEDFASPEFHFKSQGDILRQEGNERGGRIADEAWAANLVKHNEICMTLQEGSWGWYEGRPFKAADELWSNLAYARANNCNLLANIGPKPDGSLPAESVALVREVGRRIRAHGLPDATEAQAPQRGGGAGTQ
jgi:alpha-L-fucosidase